MSTAIAPKKAEKSPARRSDYLSVLGRLTELCASLAPGDSIPSHSALARSFDASEFAVLRALDELRRNGTILRRQGASTIVAERVARPVAPPVAVPEPSPVAATKVVGVLGRFAPEISELLVPYIIGQALEHALAADKTITLRYFDCFRDTAFSVSFLEGAQSLLKQEVDALCVVFPEETQAEEVLAAAQAAGVPVVFVAEGQLAQPVAQVYIDHRYDGFQAGNFFLAEGYKEVVFLLLGNYPWALERLEGVRSAFRLAGSPANAVTVLHAEHAQGVAWSERQFKPALEEWVRSAVVQNGFRGAVIASNDKVAADLLEAVEKCPPAHSSDFALLSFDDRPESSRRGLSSYRPPLFDMGKEAARLVGETLRQGEIRGTSFHSRLISQVVRRESTPATPSASHRQESPA